MPEANDGELVRKPAICFSCFHEWSTESVGRIVCPRCHNNAYLQDSDIARRATNMMCKHCHHIWIYRGLKQRPEDMICCPKCKRTAPRHQRTTMVKMRLRDDYEMMKVYLESKFPKAVPAVLRAHFPCRHPKYDDTQDVVFW